ncbi:MAG: hypothetical protein HKN82_02910 [Akkermansiaceae bacterium]|nr:hypothetical protein [Akkermansiaceae bacterium]NNM29561.1 hypothetical protein [Akkermansiaceae bacterium]
MATRDDQDFPRRRPSIFWWSLANILAATFAIVSWTTCYYVFNFPEKPSNYMLLRKIKRLPPIEEFPIEETPRGDRRDPQELYADFLKPDEVSLAALNRQYKRNFISNFKWDDYLLFVEGTYRVTAVRPLIIGDFFHPGLAIRAQAYVQPEDDTKPPGPYPVILELLLPTAEPPAANPYKEGDEFTLRGVIHRAAVIHAAKIGLESEPVICLTAVPLVYDAFETGERAMPLASPDPIDPGAPLPVMEANQPGK